MYDAIKLVSDDFKCLAISVQHQARVGAMCDALETTANELEAAVANAISQTDRSQLTKLYQGILASRRLIHQLHEMQRPPPN